jgi:fimbrial chaperone protein
MVTLKGHARSALALSLMLALGFVLDKAAPAYGANVAVSPVSLQLTRDTHSALLTITNVGSETVRFSLNTYAWAQSDSGKMELSSTPDIIFFPTLLTLGPGEARNVRLGTELLPSQNEKSYRIFLEELPSPQTSATGNGLQIHVLSKIGIPIFLVPDNPKTQAVIAPIVVHKRVLTFSVENTGNVHMVPGSATVEGSDASDKGVFNKQVPLWYILAGGKLNTSVAIPKSACAKIRTISVSIKTGTTSAKRSEPISSGACTP